MATNDTQTLVDNRETGETRLRQCQLVMLKMLKAFDRICSEHGITYFLIGGSLIGAIRHNGFIPWDDDLDIGMTRDNYEKFVKHIAELPNDIFFQSSVTDPPYPECHCVDAKLRDKYSSMKGTSLRRLGCHDGIMVDIFVYNKGFLPKKWFIVFYNVFFNRFIKSNKWRAKGLKFLDKILPFETVYASNFLCYVPSLKFGNNYLTAAEMASFVRVPFEDMEVNAPVGYDSYLTRQFGKYMVMPPEDKRVGHHSESLPDPFTPCEHAEVLYWNER